MGLLNSARECVRPSLLVFLFSDPPYPAEVVVVVIIVIAPEILIIICYCEYYCYCDNKTYFLICFS